MTLKVERDQGVDRERDPELGKKVGEEIKKQILVSASVEIVDYGALPEVGEEEQAGF